MKMSEWLPPPPPFPPPQKKKKSYIIHPSYGINAYAINN